MHGLLVRRTKDERKVQQMSKDINTLKEEKEVRCLYTYFQLRKQNDILIASQIKPYSSVYVMFLRTRFSINCIQERAMTRICDPAL